MADENEAPQMEPQFGVVAEVEGRSGQLILLNLPFGRLIDEIIVPYDKDEPFFIDGVPVTRKVIRRIKIIELGQAFRNAMWELEIGLKRGESSENWGRVHIPCFLPIFWISN